MMMTINDADGDGADADGPLIMRTCDLMTTIIVCL